jgi:hypothetical protein
MDAPQRQGEVIIMEVTPKQLIAWLPRILAANISVLILGPPGVGKSAIMATVAMMMRRELRDVRVTLLDGVDLRGLPFVAEDARTQWAAPTFFPRKSDPASILFLDELTSAPPAVQAACYQILWDRSSGEYRLPHDCAVAGAGNRREDGAVSYGIGTATASRLVQFTLKVSLDDWVSWALAAGVRHEIISYLRFAPSALHDFDPKRGGEPFPCPRTWELTSDLCKVLTGVEENEAMDVQAIVPAIAGTVGEGRAMEFSAHVQVAGDVPTYEDVVADPGGAKVPTRLDAQIASLTMCSARLQPEHVDDVLAYAERFPVEQQVLFVQDAMGTLRTVNSPRLTQWLRDNAEVLGVRTA